MKKHIEKVKEKIKIGSLLSVLIVGMVVVLMSVQTSAHGPPEINDSQLNNRLENNISEEGLEEFYEEMHDLMNKYNFGPSVMMRYSSIGCH